MSPWEIYQDRIQAHGGTKRGAGYVREVRTLRDKLPDSLSYHHATIFSPENGFNITEETWRELGDERDVAIINSDNLNEKYIYSLPEEDIELGSLVSWMDNYWLVTERDANTTVYTRAKLLQCNYLLKWIAKDGTIIEQWCAVEDGTKLEHTPVCNSLVYRKRYAKRTPLIAGTPLELRGQNGVANSRRRQRLENSTDWAISSQVSNRERFNDYPGRGSRNICSEMGSPKLTLSAW